MDLVSSIASMSMAMSETRAQQGLEMAMMKKVMQTSESEMQGVLSMMNSVPVFPGQNGSLLNVRA